MRQKESRTRARNILHLLPFTFEGRRCTANTSIHRFCNVKQKICGAALAIDGPVTIRLKFACNSRKRIYRRSVRLLVEQKKKKEIRQRPVTS